jgi:1-acyl-sn-glycerol-3-phosphate acyltransferase
MHPLAAYSFAEFGLFSAGWLPIMATLRGLSRDPVHRREGRALRRLARVITRVTPLWRFDVIGAPPPDIGHRGYVVVANHASYADPFALSHLPWDMRFVAKRELFAAPLVGWLLKLAGDIPLARGDRDSASEMLAACRQTLAQGLSVMIFPEGTRTRDGALGVFKTGAFRVAIEAEAPILPVVLHDTAACTPARGGIGFARAEVEVLPPIESRQRGLDSLRAEARNAISTALQRRGHRRSAALAA